MKSSQTKISNSENFKNNDKIRLRDLDDSDSIRIFIDMTYLEKEITNSELLEIYKYSLDKAKITLQKLIKVKSRTSDIDISQIDFSKFRGFSRYLFDSDLLNGNKKIPADLAIFVRQSDGIELEKCGEEPTIVEKSNKRPIVGYIIIDQTLYTKTEDIEGNVYRKELYSYYFLHQLTHILGFKREIIDSIGEISLIPKEVYRIHSSDEKKLNKQIIHGAKILEKAQSYFDCYVTDTLNGIEIEENQENDCSEYIHWESRILLGDYMTSLIYVQEQVISDITLAFLEDTNFYEVNYFTGGLMKFGKKKGCTFFTNDCNALLPVEQQTNNTVRSPTFINEFCASSTKTTCTPARQSRGICDNTEPQGRVGEKYMRTGWGEMYGNKNAEYCPISLSEKEFDNQKYSYFGNCKIGTKENFGKYAFKHYKYVDNYDYSFFSDTYGEVFGNNSFCAFSSVIHKDDLKNEQKKKLIEDFIRPTCYEMYCSDSSLTIKINSQYSQYIVCPKIGGFIQINGNYTGHLLCPDFNLICSQSIPCNNMFDCVDKKSKEKDLDYNYTPNEVSVQILLPDLTKTYDKAYEESENGKCPKDCSECNEYKQCFECSPSAPIYVGVRDNDQNPINCSETPPDGPYYETTKSDNKKYYFKCIDNCKKCDSADYCIACEPEYELTNSNKECKVRIEGCKKYDEGTAIEEDPLNGHQKAYRDCEICDEDSNYYCLGDDRKHCIKLDKTSYYKRGDNGCYEKCTVKHPYCNECTEAECTKCLEGYHLNNNKDCVDDIPNCDTHDDDLNPVECIWCKEGYACLNDNKKNCIKVDIDLYYNIDNDCRMEKCSIKYPNCKNCTKEICINCFDNYFLYNNEKCFKKIDNCLREFYDGTNTFCEVCNPGFYCIEFKKEECIEKNDEELKEYYLIGVEYAGKNFQCYDKCRNIYPNCLECTKDQCNECKPYFIKSSDNKKCTYNTSTENVDSICSIKFHEINDDIKKINLIDFPDNYYHNLPSLKVIDHYINKDYTITVFIHSECTEELLKNGYFKIDSKELQNSIVKEFNVNEKLIYTVFVTYNFKSHFRYHDEDLNYLDTSVKSESAKSIDYTITNYYIKNINETLGPIVANLVESEKINIFEKESDVYNNYCQNITLLKIDIPLKLRLLLLYPNDYSEKMACLGENCVIEEFNFDESTCTCKCKMGNKFEDIFVETEFKHYDGPMTEFNNFIDSIGIIRCTLNGFNSKNMKANAGLFLVLIGIVAQIVLYIYYLLCSEPITNLSKVTNNPPKRAIMIFSDWDKRMNKRNDSEGEVFIQPRDDADEQLLEEERSYSNNGNTSSISIDTDVGGVNVKNKKNKLSEKPDRKVLILLKNKGGKKSKSEKEYDDSKSDSEIIKLNDERNIENISFCQLYWSVVSLKQHIINYFSFIHCCKITKSYIPLSMRIIRSIFLFFLSFVFNILFLNQTYYEKKFNHFNEKYNIIHSEILDLKISTGERIGYAISNTFAYAIICFILLIIVNFIVGYFFFSIRNSVGEIMKNNNISEINDLVSKTKKKNIIFFIINIVLMIIFFLTITAFVGAYGGGFVDYFTSGIISLIFLELFPFLWSLIITLFIYLGFKSNNKCLSNFGKFFMF